MILPGLKSRWIIAGAVSAIERLGHFAGDAQGLVERQRAVLETLAQSFALG